jgi:hypothetical protein
MSEWNKFDPPIPVEHYTLSVGTYIRIKYIDGLMSHPVWVTRDLLIGDINKDGGLCDDCSIYRLSDCVVLAEKVWSR